MGTACVSGLGKRRGNTDALRKCRRLRANALTCMNAPRSRFALCAMRLHLPPVQNRSLTHALINLNH